jgi:hypothetical protein
VSTGQGGGVWTQQASKLVGTGAVGSPSKVSPARDRGHVIQKAAYSQNATGENNQIAGVCGISVLARLFDSGHHRQVDQWPGITASSTCTVLIEAVNGTQ